MIAIFLNTKYQDYIHVLLCKNMLIFINTIKSPFLQIYKYFEMNRARFKINRREYRKCMFITSYLANKFISWNITSNKIMRQ